MSVKETIARYRDIAARMRASGKHSSAESWERAARELETGRAEW